MPTLYGIDDGKEVRIGEMRVKRPERGQKLIGTEMPERGQKLIGTEMPACGTWLRLDKFT